MNPTIKSDELEKYLNDKYKSWYNGFNSNNVDDCKELLSQLINELKPIYIERQYGENEEAYINYVYVYVSLILAKGLKDVTNLMKLTRDKQWPNDNKKAESIWQLLWDAKERFDIFSRHCLDPNILDYLYDKLKCLELSFYDCFGKGLYMSPVTIIDKHHCSICGKNIKGCEHLPGNFYQGKMCKEIADNIKFMSADIVQSPQDMRCRIWPWNFTDDMTFSARIMNFNPLDGFIFESKE